MQIKADHPQAYIEAVPSERREALTELRKTLLRHLPKGFAEEMSYGMIGYVVPHTLYPAGYRADPKQPLPFINLACQKNHIALYHMAMYADKTLLEWYRKQFKEQYGKLPDMGKSCLRFKKNEEIPFLLLSELFEKVSVKDWISLYETQLVNSRKR